ncbi:MAG TPA: hypothetical protein VI792_11830 [Candidatus Eisenbacteria bacterium]
MILWLDGLHDPGENMRRDARLLAAAGAGALGAPVLRLFGFDPPGITLGHAQDPARELDLERCRRDGVPWAVRPTGGRAIFHAEEWTYSFAAARAGPWGSGTVADAYARLSALIVRSLERLGLPAALAQGTRAPRAAGAGGRGVAPPCFASTARHEIVLGGRKLVGSAQRRTAGAMLQQGSVLLGPGHLRLADYLRLPEGERGAARAALAAAAADAGAWIPPGSPLSRWAGALREVLPAETRLVEGEAGVGLAAPAPAGECRTSAETPLP